MAYHYLIDGYNVMHALETFPAGTWAEKCAHLVAFLADKRLQGQNALTVVFDNRKGGASRVIVKGLTVVYTGGETADENIIDTVRASKQPRSIVVVSNDMGIRLMLKGTGARFMAATEFLKGAKRPTHTAPTPDAPDERITEELSRRWI